MLLGPDWNLGWIFKPLPPTPVFLLLFDIVVSIHVKLYDCHLLFLKYREQFHYCFGVFTHFMCVVIMSQMYQYA